MRQQPGKIVLVRDRDGVFGIDLGSTYSVIGYIDQTGRPAVVINSEGSDTTASVVFFESEHDAVVGTTAKRLAGLYPDQVVSLIKREVGNENYRRTFFGVEYTPASVSALILGDLARDAREYTGREVTNVVIAVPAYFGLLERHITKRAGEIAGLKVTSIIPEPVAAVMHYGVTGSTDGTTVLVYDLGGATFDVSLIKVTEDSVQVLIVDGDHRLGGADWDMRLFDHIVDQVIEQVGDDSIMDDEEALQELRLLAESTKQALSAVESRTAAYRRAGTFARMVVTREQFEEMTADLLELTIRITNQMLASAEEEYPGIRQQVSQLLLVGGSSRMPMVRERMEREFDWEIRLTDPHLAVAKGAALFARRDHFALIRALPPPAPHAIGSGIPEDESIGAPIATFIEDTVLNSTMPDSAQSQSLAEKAPDEKPAESTLTVFCSYSHRDEDLKDKLDAHLSSLRREGLIRTWHDRKVVPGSDWAAEIDEYVAKADIFIALVSADFINSDYCWGIELARALDRQAHGQAVVVPVIIRPVAWRNTPLGVLQALPRDGRAVTAWNNRDKAWTDVAGGLRALVKEFHSRTSGEGNSQSTRSVVQEDIPSSGPAISFSHINVIGEKTPRWRELEHDAGHCCFGANCDRYFHLKDFVEDADLWLDVTILNSSRAPIILTAVGAEILDVMQISYVYGIPEAAKISRPADEYVLTMPYLRELIPEFTFESAEEAVSVNREIRTRLTDPVYLPARAPYRFILRFAGYQRNIPNHARLRLVAETEDQVAKSRVLHIFTW